MTEPPRPHRFRWLDRLASLTLILEGALFLRVLAADLVQWVAQRRGALCLFPDTTIYWMLAGTIERGESFEVVEWGNLPKFSIRTPGYPLFLAACRLCFGDRLLPVRLVQAALGMACVWLVYRLTRDVVPADAGAGRVWTTALIAAALAAVEPYFVVTAALVLSEAVFLPLMLFSLWGLARLWTPAAAAPCRHATAWALATGAASGAAILVRPSWALFVPAVLAAWFLCEATGRRARAAWGGAWIVLALVAVMAPWWVRNERVYGRFVPTALWMGASLYDGLNPRANGASDMRFLADPDLWPLGEEEQDVVLRRRAWAFVRARPGRVLELALIKLGRFWSPWPNAESFRAPVVSILSTLVNVPLFVAMALGVIDRRRDARALVLLAGPMLYFCALHLVFVSSMRYRIPGAVPAFGLAAVGISKVLRDRDGSKRDEPPSRQAAKEEKRGREQKRKE